MKVLPFISPELIALYCMALVDGMLQMSTLWVALLFLNHINFTDSQHHTFYVLTSALEYAVPLVANIPLSYCATKYGARVVVTYSYLIISLGMLSFIICRTSRALYISGVIFFSFFWSNRIIRISLVARIVSADHRTTAIAGHQFMLACGSALGPICWYIAQLWRGSFSVFGVVFDRFTVLFILNGILQCTMSFTSYLSLPDSRLAERITSQKFHFENNDVRSADYGSTVEVEKVSSLSLDSKSSLVRTHIAFFSTISFLVRGSSGIFLVAIQPILVDTFRTNDDVMAKITFIIAIFATLSPLLAGAMAKLLPDRHLLMFALAIQFIGMTLFLPITVTITRSQVVFGILLIVQASIMFTTISVSLFSKLLGSLYKHSYIGYLWSSAMLGIAISQAASTKWIVPFFGHWSFGLFSLPTVIVILTVRAPVVWSFLKTPNERSSC